MQNDRLDADVFVENTETYQDKNYSANKFRLQTLDNRLTTHNAKDIAKYRHYERTYTDNGKRHGKLVYALIAKTRKGDAHRQCIDTCRHGKKQLTGQLRRIEMCLIFTSERVFYHLTAKKCQKAESYPVVNGFEVMTEITRTQPSYKRHHCLKKAEQKCHAQYYRQDVFTDDNSTYY